MERFTICMESQHYIQRGVFLELDGFGKLLWGKLTSLSQKH